MQVCNKKCFAQEYLHLNSRDLDLNAQLLGPRHINSACVPLASRLATLLELVA